MNTPTNPDDIAHERMLEKCETARDVEVADAVIAGAESNRACRPILFIGEMVRAILDGRKTQTRRVVKDLTDDDRFSSPTDCYFYAPSKIDRNGMLYPGEEVYGIAHEDAGWVCPYGAPGDRLWVRETFVVMDAEGFRLHRSGSIRYKEDPTTSRLLMFRPSIFMPRWASRITLEIVSVSVERVREMSNEDAQAEGIQVSMDEHSINKYADLWDSINGKKHPWSSNPWVWVITFRRIHP